MMIIKSNFSSPIIFNSVLEPVLAFIPITGKSNRKLQYYEPKNISYVTVLPSSIDEVEFQLADVNGHEIVMADSVSTNNVHVNFIIKHEI